MDPKDGTTRAFDLDAVFARNRALYGDLRMEAGEGGGAETPAEGAEGQEPTPPVEPPTEPPSEDDKGDEAKGDEKPTLSHEEALAELAKVRREAGGYRTRLRDAEDKLAGAKTPEEMAAAIQEIKEANASDVRNLMVENVALAHNLPEDLAAALKAFNGDTREEIEAHAKVLAKYVDAGGTTPDADSLSGGTRPDNDDDDATFDPAAAARKARKSRY